MWATVLGGVIGGVGGWLFLWLVYRQASWLSVAVGTLIGMMVVLAMQWGEPPATRR